MKYYHYKISKIPWEFSRKFNLNQKVVNWKVYQKLLIVSKKQKEMHFFTWDFIGIIRLLLYNALYYEQRRLKVWRNVLCQSRDFITAINLYCIISLFLNFFSLNKFIWFNSSVSYCLSRHNLWMILFCWISLSFYTAGNFQRSLSDSVTKLNSNQSNKKRKLSKTFELLK